MEYTLKELAELSEVTARTIRRYISKGLMEGAEGRGRSARYSAHHLKRLKTIRKLREEYDLSLDEIHEQFLAAGEEDVDFDNLQGQIEAPLQEQKALLEERDRVRQMLSSQEQSLEDLMNVSARTRPKAVKKRPAAVKTDTVEEAAPSKQPLDVLKKALGLAEAAASDGENWRHIAISSDITLQVRGEFASKKQVLVDQITRGLKRILRDS